MDIDLENMDCEECAELFINDDKDAVLEIIDYMLKQHKLTRDDLL